MAQTTDSIQGFFCPVVNHAVQVTVRTFAPALGDRGVMADQPRFMIGCTGNVICRIFSSAFEFTSDQRNTGCPYHDNLNKG